MSNGLWSTIVDNAVFVVEVVLIAAVLVAVAYLAERFAKKKNGDTERVLSTRKLAMIGVFSAIAVVLHIFDFPVFFGPVAGVMIEFCKIVLKLFIKGTSTAFVGDLANFAVGCSFILPASIIYMFKKSKKNAIVACVAGTLCMTVFGSAFNAIYLLPAFSKLYGMPLDVIVGMGTAINGNITSVITLVIFAVAPMNLLKGGAVSLVTMLIYKPLSPILKAGIAGKAERRKTQA